MCHYKYAISGFTYWGYDVCSHEYRSTENYWMPCHLGGRVAPQRCPFVSYSRRPVGQPFCDSCLDETPPAHPPVTAIIRDLEHLRRIMDEAGVDQAFRVRFSREYRAELRDARDRAAAAGADNNYYNDVSALYRIYHQRASDAVARVSTWDGMLGGRRGGAAGEPRGSRVLGRR